MVRKAFPQAWTPTALFSKQLAALERELEDSEQFPSSFCAATACQFVMSSAGSHRSEAEREVALRSVLRSLISGNVVWQEKLDNGSDQPDRVWVEEHFAYIIIEIKNESGSAGDPILQGLTVYSKILAQGKA